ncbi:hypothetical protein J4466_04310 [Candidatus Pacearchaeota archaeon]|nr:hypothetical protein [Candidatus Pacearchaeota archaeon]
MENNLVKLTEYRIVDFLRHNPTHGIKVSGLHRKLRFSYEQLNPALDNLVMRGIIKRDKKYYRPDNLSAYHAMH